MAYSKIQMPGNGTSGPYTVNFTLGYLSQSDVTARVNAEVDGLGAPVYRTITWVDVNLATLSGTAPTALDTITFERTVSKDTLKHDFNDGAPITEKNLDESHKQALMAVHEALDGRFGALQSDFDVGNHRIINVLDPVDSDDAATKAYVDLQVFASGGIIAPTAPDVGKILTATGVGTYGWGNPTSVPNATESVAGVGEIATQAEITTGTDDTNKFINVLKAVTAFARLNVQNLFTVAQFIRATSGHGLTIEGSADNAGEGGSLYLNKLRATTVGVVNDTLPVVRWQAKNGSGTTKEFGTIYGTLSNVTAGTEAAIMRARAIVAGAIQEVFQWANGVVIGAPTGSFKGLGTLNIQTGLYVGGVAVAGPSAKFSHETGNAVDGGATVATTWTTLPLNTTKHNNIPGCSLASNQVTLAAGTYRVRGWHCFYNTAFRWRLRNITDGTDFDLSGTFKTPTGLDVGAHMDDIEFTIAGSKVIAMQYYASTASATGLGVSTGSPPTYNEKWGELYIEKIA